MNQLEQISVIIETVCHSYSVSYSELCENGYNRQHTEARSIIWSLIRSRFYKQTSFSYLGGLFGMCKRSAQNGIRRVKIEKHEDTSFVYRFMELERKCYAKLN